MSPRRYSLFGLGESTLDGVVIRADGVVYRLPAEEANGAVALTGWSGLDESAFPVGTDRGTYEGDERIDGDTNEDAPERGEWGRLRGRVRASVGAITERFGVTRDGGIAEWGSLGPGTGAVDFSSSVSGFQPTGRPSGRTAHVSRDIGGGYGTSGGTWTKWYDTSRGPHGTEPVWQYSSRDGTIIDMSLSPPRGWDPNGPSQQPGTQQEANPALPKPEERQREAATTPQRAKTENPLAEPIDASTAVAERKLREFRPPNVTSNPAWSAPTPGPTEPGESVDIDWELLRGGGVVDPRLDGEKVRPSGQLPRSVYRRPVSDTVVFGALHGRAHRRT